MDRGNTRQKDGVMMVDTAISNKALIKKLKVAKYKCLESLLFSTRYFFKHKQNRKFVVGDHHTIMCEALERVLNGQCKRLIINVAPRYSKTEIAVKNFIAHGLALNPAAKFIHLSYSDTLALDNSEEVKDLVQEDFYQELFPEVQIKADSKAKKKWYTTAGGGVYATAAAGQVTGFGAGQVDEEEEEFKKNLDEFLDGICEEMENEHPITKKKRFGGAIIIDDAIKPEDADSDTIRERVNNRFDSTIRNRVNSRNTPIIVIMQRLHPQDLAGYLQSIEPGEWEVVSLPCLYVGEDGELKALWPFKHTVEELQKLKALNDIVFERQYQQNPKPKEGLLFPEEDLSYYNPETVDVYKMAEFRVMIIDPADEGGDDLAAPIGFLIGDKIYIPDVIYNAHGTDVNEPACVEKILTNKLNHVRIEGNSAWILFGKAVRSRVQDDPPKGKGYTDCEIRIVKNSKNKHTRILARSSFVKLRMVFRSDYAKHPQYYKFMQNLTSYNRIQNGMNKNKHDDAPDSLAEMADYFEINFAHLW
jgi:predicted phage terminase large subunit-like protein